jgi:hypothetical protein
MNPDELRPYSSSAKVCGSKLETFHSDDATMSPPTFHSYFISRLIPHHSFHRSFFHREYNWNSDLVVDVWKYNLLPLLDTTDLIAVRSVCRRWSSIIRLPEVVVFDTVSKSVLKTMCRRAERIFVKSATSLHVSHLLDFTASSKDARVTSVCFDEDSIDQAGLQLVASALKRNAPLRRLNFAGWSDGRSLRDICGALKKNTHLEQLSLRSSPFDARDALALSHALSTNRSLKELVLLGTRFDAATTTVFFESLCKNSTLTSLSLSCSHWDVAAASALASLLLQPHCSLTDLKLSQAIGLNSESFAIISNALADNKSLTSLSVEVNSLLTGATASTSRSFEQLLKKNTTLKSLCLWHGAVAPKPGVNDQTHSDVATSVFEGAHLSKLKIYGLDMSAASAASVSEKLKSNAKWWVNFVVRQIQLLQARLCVLR